jgi:D-serine deaminase-like pyridoxal phosphate-dependent protein
MEHKTYALAEEASLLTPALLCYEDFLKDNTRKAIAIAGGPQRLWPHVKTHKSADIVRLMQAMGIRRFKCATIAEAQMLADCEAAHILLAYPLIGPNVERFFRLRGAYPKSAFYAIADSREGLFALSQAAGKAGAPARVLLDINLGMDRTGAPLKSAQALYRYAGSLPDLALHGLHCYDGHRREADKALRQRRVDESNAQVTRLQADLIAQGLPCPLLVMGGTPSFPCHAKHPEVFLSPGTCFLWDAGYQATLPDLPFVPAAVLKTRVVSHPAPGLFTLDLGYKGIAADPAGPRGRLVELPKAAPHLHSEEHWVWQVPLEEAVPPIGALLTVIPTHICPTSALYPAFQVVREGRVAAEWPVTARNRRLTF